MQNLVEKMRAAASWPLMIMLTASAIVLFYDLGGHPIEVWDESRLANNAIEMALSGFSLVTTFDWQPDHWNTKPPLLIWLMAATLRLFGFDEFGVRLPGALAAFGTVITLWAFLAYRLGRPVAGCLAVLLLLATSDYVEIHGARSGNYEPLLGLLSMGYLLAAYLYFRADAGRRRWLVLTVALAFLAFMTKTVQAFLFLPSIMVFLIVARDRQRFVEVSLATALLILLVAAYYVAREIVDPGYIAAAIGNDLLGRYADVLDGHDGDYLFYLRDIGAAPRMQFGLLASIMLSVLAKGELRMFGRYLLVVMAGYMVVISMAETKLSWYAFPLLPLVAASAALLVCEAMSLAARRLRWFAEPHRNLVAMAIVLFYAVVVVALNVKSIVFDSGQPSLADACNRFLFTKEAREASRSGLAIFHWGYNSGNYHAPTSFYTKILDAEGGRTMIVAPGGTFPPTFEFALACSADTVKRFREDGQALATIAGDDNLALLRMRQVVDESPGNR